MVDKIDYRGQTKIYATFPAQTSTEWIEAGQAITANVSVKWDDTNMAIRLLIHEYQLGEAPEAKIALGRWYPMELFPQPNGNIPGKAIQDENGD